MCGDNCFFFLWNPSDSGNYFLLTLACHECQWILLHGLVWNTYPWIYNAKKKKCESCSKYCLVYYSPVNNPSWSKKKNKFVQFLQHIKSMLLDPCCSWPVRTKARTISLLGAAFFITPCFDWNIQGHQFTCLFNIDHKAMQTAQGMQILIQEHTNFMLTNICTNSNNIPWSFNRFCWNWFSCRLFNFYNLESMQKIVTILILILAWKSAGVLIKLKRK